MSADSLVLMLIRLCVVCPHGKQSLQNHNAASLFLCVCFSVCVCASVYVGVSVCVCKAWTVPWNQMLFVCCIGVFAHITSCGLETETDGQRAETEFICVRVLTSCLSLPVSVSPLFIWTDSSDNTAVAHSHTHTHRMEKFIRMETFGHSLFPHSVLENTLPIKWLDFINNMWIVDKRCLQYAQPCARDNYLFPAP